MVSKASDDLPLPLNPVITVIRSRGIKTSIFLRLCSRAPLTRMPSRERSASVKTSLRLTPGTHAVELEDVMGQPEIMRPRHLFLQVLDHVVFKLHDLAA